MATGLSTDGKPIGKRCSDEGITINPDLISTSTLGSSDVQDELSGLGVSVYNQVEFEAGVLKQIDNEVQRQNAEQDKKFLLKDYSSVKGEANSVRFELNTISKAIAGLLSLPLSTVSDRLRELKAAQKQKTQQLKTLEAREHAILEKLTRKDDPEANKSSSSCTEPSTSGDVSFGFPMEIGGEGGAISDQQRLIRTGQLTPFGTTVEQVPSSSSLPIEEQKSGLSPVVNQQAAALSTSTEATAIQSESSSNVMPNEKEPRIKLSSSDFDGLFSNGPIKKRQARIPKKKKRANLEENQDTGQSSGVLTLLPNSSTSEPSMENTESDHDDWMPSLADFLASDQSSSSSEYFTDEELGEVKRKRLRPLSSDDLSSDEEVKSARKGKGKRRRKGKRKVTTRQRYNGDDGDEELYLQRLQIYEESKSADTPPNMNFDGGLTIPGSIWHRLYRYQQTGVKWLWELHCQQAGGIVGDEMGLGKTIQAIAFLAGLKISNLRSHVTRKLGLGPVLIVCPATVMHQWVSEFHTWWPPFRAVVLHDSGTYSGSKRLLVEDVIKDDGVLITTYSSIRLYKDLLLQHKWDYVILDEGHKIRNPDAELTLACKQVCTPHRLILSGSPMQNNLRELWSLFDFIFPGKLGTLPVFMEQFSVPITQGGYANATEVQVQTAYKCACILRDSINPYMLRRLKADVKIHLPDKNEQVLFCRLTEYQVELYRDYIRSSTVEAMLNRGKEVFAGLMALRKLCNHPDLVTNDYSDQVIYSKDEVASKKGRKVRKVLNTRQHKVSGVEENGANLKDGFEDEESYGYWKRSGKMIIVESLLKLWKIQSHRVLLFTQSKAMLDILEMFVRKKGYRYQRMDGTTPISTRQPLVNKFNQDNSIFIFLLTTRVGGLGINLTGADRVIIYDPDWNPSTDTQARERAWRIGQTRPVTIYRLLTSGTIEEKIYHRQIFKQFLTNRVLKDPRQRRFFKSNNLYELFTLSASAIEGGTETGDIFAGTGSEILPRQSGRPKRVQRSRDTKEATGKRKRKSKNGDDDKRKKSKKAKKSLYSCSTLDIVKETNDGKNLTADSEQMTAGQSTNEAEVPDEVIESEDKLNDAGKSSAGEEVEVAGESPGQARDKVVYESVAGSSLGEVALKDGDKKPGSILNESSKNDDGAKEKEEIFRENTTMAKKKKKKRRKKHDQPAEVEGERIEGLVNTCIFNPGQEDEEQNAKQDDFILQKLFKKSAVHSALQHDTIMSSGDPDYVLVESEASKVAKSAAKALKASRHHCLQMGAGRGRPTWTGQHGSAGAPATPRFGLGANSQSKTVSSSKQLFNGLKLSDDSSSGVRGSINTSSSVLLAKMRLRNTHTRSDGGEQGMGGASGLHEDSHSQLVREMRDFIATQSKVNGQATTGEILEKFATELAPSDTAMFRSMLYEICDFSRYHGDGLWSLKPEFR